MTNKKRYISHKLKIKTILIMLVTNVPTSPLNLTITPFLAPGAYAFRSAAAKADEKPASEGEQAGAPQQALVSSPSEVDTDPSEKEETVNSRIYDATVIGEPVGLGKDKTKVWEKMMDARIVYLGEAEQVPVADDRELELEIVKNLLKRCGEAERNLALALEAFPCNLQEQLDQYMDDRFGFFLNVAGGC